MLKKVSIYWFILVVSFFSANTLYAQTVSGTLAVNATVCANNNNGVLNLTGYVGAINRWEYSLNGSSLWTTIANNSDSYNYINLSQTTYFRAIVQAPSFPENASNSIKITVNATSIGGQATSTFATECFGNTVKLALQNYTGSILNWQSSINNGISWQTLATSNDSITKHDANITQNKLYRATVQNGVCLASVSDSVKVTVAPTSVGGITSASATVCEAINNNTISVTSQTGNVTRWESSTTGLAPWLSIANTTTVLPYTNLQTSTYYRAIIKSANCPEASSSQAFIKVDALSNGGFITGTQNVCSNLNTGLLNLNGNNGSVLQWEFSTNNGTTWNTTPVTNTTYTIANINQHTTYRVLVANGVCASAYSHSFLVTVSSLPIVNYTVANACQGKSIAFTNISSGNNSYNWDFKDGENSTITNPSHVFNVNGNYAVKLTATSLNGCVDSITETVIVYAKPMVGFISIDSTCSFNAINFTNNSSISNGTITSYIWGFGDNSSTTNFVNTSHTYTMASMYSVKLIATSNNGCKDSLTKTLEVFPKPDANFTTNNVCKKTAANFVNTSFINNGGITYQWNFGDAYTSTLTSPTHSYTNAGNYNVSLICTSNHVCKDTIIKSLTVNEQPNLTIQTANVCQTKQSFFTQTVTPITNYTLQWNFGNGTTVTGNNSQYIYPASGSYNVLATLTTDSGCVSLQALNTQIYSMPYVAFNVNNVCNTDSVLITNLSSLSFGNLSYNWDLGNGSNSQVINPKTKYTIAKTYSVELIATTNSGCKDSITKTITVYDAPNTNFTAINACDGKPIVFTNNSTVVAGTITNYNWTFGDNSTSAQANPSKTYAGFGTYTVSLEATSSNACRATLTKTVTVYEGAKANFLFTNKCVDQAIPFINSTTLQSGTYNSVWLFGDNTTSTINSPTHLYQVAGTKTVTLKAITNNGCRDSVIKQVQVFALPIVNAGNDTTISKGFSINLIATGGNAYAWFPPEGLNNTGIQNPIATPPQTTDYVVEAKSINGCINTDTIKITINDDFLVLPYNIVTPDGNGKNDTWIVKNIESYPNNAVTILDEWGVVVFEQTVYDNSWEGRNKQGNILPDGTYYYILTLNDINKVYKGFVAVLRNR